MEHHSGTVLVLSGPSGAGKSSLINKVSKSIGDYYFSISTTTRPKREGEIDGVHYNFVSQEEFEKDIKEDLFLEYALVHGNYYGTSLKPVKEALQAGKLVIFDIDVQGNAMVKNRLGELVTSVFIATPTLSILKQRLTSRATDSQEIIDKRLKMARKEIQRISEYDYLLINDDLEEASKKLKIIIEAAKLKSSSNEINEFIQKWEDIE
ncbi:Guanylate kinase [hydrothermal vent metagenome]|uniref:guanylate kinase n=1 Tax=hydrothermal vent metagenome TaxID=652676 RepID=A0A1W1D2B6_9ZZZZ